MHINRFVLTMLLQQLMLYSLYSLPKSLDNVQVMTVWNQDGRTIMVLQLQLHLDMVHRARTNTRLRRF